jgi:hypothetical protein
VSRVGRDYAYRQVRERILRDAQVCYLCAGELDFDAPPRSRWAPTIDHVLPVSALRNLDSRTARRLAIDPSGLRPAHYGCNAARGNGRNHRPRHASRSW